MLVFPSAHSGPSFFLVVQVLSWSWAWYSRGRWFLPSLAPSSVLRAWAQPTSVKPWWNSATRIEKKFPILCITPHQVQTRAWKLKVFLRRVWGRARCGRREFWSFQRLEAGLPSLLSFQSNPDSWVCVSLNTKDQSPFFCGEEKKGVAVSHLTRSTELNSITCTFCSCSFCLSWKSRLAGGKKDVG